MRKVIAVEQGWLGGVIIGGVPREKLVSGESKLSDLERLGVCWYEPIRPQSPGIGQVHFEVREDGVLIQLAHNPDTSDY